MSAYNYGDYRVLRVIRSQNVNYLNNFWDLYARLPRETTRYVPGFLATLHIFRNPNQYGLNAVNRDPPMKLETVIVSKQVHLEDIAEKTGVSGKILKELNPKLRYRSVPGDQYALRVPPGKRHSLVAVMNQIPAAAAPRPVYVYHKIRRGNTLSTIAGRYRISVSSTARANRIPKRKYRCIVAGKWLKTPQKGIIYRRKNYLKSKRWQVFTHVIRRGDSLWILAKKYGTTTKQIQAPNHLFGTQLHIGQKLKLSSKGHRFSTAGLKTYLVRRGDTPFKIQNSMVCFWGVFLRLNGLTPRGKIYPNQALYVVMIPIS
jgi:membrane-bound lytic murein transglycosylase D